MTATPVMGVAGTGLTTIAPADTLVSAFPREET